jgi:uncharacterized membrane protein YkoI
MLICAFAWPTSLARADDDDLDRLRDAVRRAEVMPLSTLQDQVRKTFPGEIISVEIDEDDGRFIYEFKVLQTSGRLLEIEMDAKDGEVLDIDDDD